MDPDFLEEVFDLQMQAMEDPESAKVLAKQQYDQLYNQTEEIFRKWEAGEGELHLIEENLAKMKYFSNLISA